MTEISGLTPSGSITDSLLHSAQQGNREALNRIVDLFSPGIHWRAEQKGLSADDVVQDVFFRATRRIAKFRRDLPGQGFRKWLNKIATNVMKNHYQARSRNPMPLRFEPEGSIGSEEDDDLPPRQQGHQDAEDREPEVGVAHDDVLPSDQELVRRVVDLVCGETDNKSCQCFKRKWFEGQSSPEIAAALGMTPKAVRQACVRVKQRIEKQFGELLGPDDPFRQCLRLPKKGL